MNYADLLEYEEREREKRLDLWYGWDCPLCGHRRHTGRMCTFPIGGDGPCSPANHREPCGCPGNPICPKCGQMESDRGLQRFPELGRDLQQFHCVNPDCELNTRTHSIEITRKEGA